VLLHHSTPVWPNIPQTSQGGEVGGGVTILTVNLSNLWKSASTLADRLSRVETSYISASFLEGEGATTVMTLSLVHW